MKPRVEVDFSRLLTPPVPFVALIILGLWRLGFYVIQEQFSYYSVKGLGHSLLYGLLGAMTVITFVSTVVVDPGKVPEDYQPDVEGNEAGVLEVKKSTGEVRRCKKCLPNVFKPPRTHHCRRCNRCILRLCHHCPWLGACIGHCNYRSYFLFLLYIVASLWELTVLLVTHAIAGFGRAVEVVSASAQQSVGQSLGSVSTAMSSFTSSLSALPSTSAQPTAKAHAVPLLPTTAVTLPASMTVRPATAASAAVGTATGAATTARSLLAQLSIREPPSTLYCVAISLVTLMVVALLLGLGLLFIWHVGLTARNCTTIEHYEGVSRRGEQGSRPQGGVRERHLYDLGVGENFFQVLGPNPLMWLFPFPTSVQGDGLRYTTFLDLEREKGAGAAPAVGLDAQEPRATRGHTPPLAGALPLAATSSRPVQVSQEKGLQLAAVANGQDHVAGPGDGHDGLPGLAGDRGGEATLGLRSS